MEFRMKKPIRVARISKKNLDKLIEAGYIVIICGWGRYEV
jgi:hypothetical protein